jgi:hypothetical protein
MSESQSRRDIEYQVGTTTCINAMIIRINDKFFGSRDKSSLPSPNNRQYAPFSESSLFTLTVIVSIACRRFQPQIRRLRPEPAHTIIALA